MDNEYKVKSIRADEEAYEKFKAIAQEEFGNQGQCFATLINLYETEKSKTKLVERKLEIDSFQSNLNKISELFLMSLEMNQEAEERIRGEFSKLLESKDKTIQDLQEKAAESKTKVEELKSLYDDEVIKSKEIADKYYEIKIKYDEDTKNYKQTIEDKENLNKALTDTCNEKKLYIQSLEGTIESNKNDIEDYYSLRKRFTHLEMDNMDLQAKLDQDKNTHESELKDLRSKLELEKEKALFNLEKEHQAELKELYSKNTEEIKSYVEKLEKLQEKYNNLIEQNSLKRNDEVKKK